MTQSSDLEFDPERRAPLDDYVPLEELGKEIPHVVIGSDDDLPRDAVNYAHEALRELFPQLNNPETMTVEDKRYWLALTTTVAGLTIDRAYDQANWQFLSPDAIRVLQMRTSQQDPAIATATLQAFDRFVRDNRDRLISPGKVKNPDMTPELLLRSLYGDFNRVRQRQRLPLL